MGAVDDHGAFGVDDAGTGVVGVVGGDEGFFFIAEDSFQGAFSGCFEGGVDFVDGDFFFEFEDEVGEGGVEEEARVHHLQQGEELGEARRRKRGEGEEQRGEATRDQGKGQQ